MKQLFPQFYHYYVYGVAGLASQSKPTKKEHTMSIEDVKDQIMENLFYNQFVRRHSDHASTRATSTARCARGNSFKGRSIEAAFRRVVAPSV
jgi:hypothetical protein